MGNGEMTHDTVIRPTRIQRHRRLKMNKSSTQREIGKIKLN